jgi:uncharacterized protein (TIGR02271 family)
MTKTRAAQVVDDAGVHGTVESGLLDDDGNAPVLVQLESGERVLVPRELLVEREDGSYRLAARLATLLDGRADGALVIPVIEERAHVRRVESVGKVAITKTVQERIEQIDEPLTSEEVVVERVPVNRPVDKAPMIRHEGDTLVIPLLEEVLVVEKRLVLREEVHVRKVHQEIRSPQEVSLRSEQIEITRQPVSSGDE